ncbi:arylamine N-acetyltransferase family protein [Paraburkholderia lycopersici]|uniref:N-hydroxyarylamine O-acetyltransferase n=1 Tax=Paraburkholderia lycopersici TaxID=416944 RepID=A0A1G6XMC3_9BURK|nr:arylamine N-acetyltransferase [Paraburkholderia lycopersici]SDD78497.1 N-hydroxyarylamine O-acetyltransferase [Paraburkholderia lycopersici]
MTDIQARYEVDLDRYFERIGYDGPRAATLAVLRDLHRLHPLAIPFENLDPLAGRRVSVALPDVVEKLVARRRGGYCFEHNTLLAHVLIQLGFEVTPLAARVLYGREPGARTPRTHMLLRVEAEGDSWLADVGFGGATLCAPLSFSTEAEQQTPHEPARITRSPANGRKLELFDGEKWIDLYRFELTPAEWVDYEMANWYTSASPESFFTFSLIACIAREGGRAILFNEHLSERDAQGRVIEERTIASAEELAQCLRERFGIDLARGDAAQCVDAAALYARMMSRGAKR